MHREVPSPQIRRVLYCFATDDRRPTTDDRRRPELHHVLCSFAVVVGLVACSPVFPPADVPLRAQPSTVAPSTTGSARATDTPTAGRGVATPATPPAPSATAARAERTASAGLPTPRGTATPAVQPTPAPARSTPAPSVSDPQVAGGQQPAATPVPAATTSTNPVARAGAPSFLRTDGSRIVDSRGQEVRITGVNWFGLETPDFAPHGLWERNWQEMLDQVVDLGFNTLRLPFSTEMLDPASRPRTINYQVNADLRDRTPLEILDRLVEGAGQRGLRVVLDRHRPEGSAQSPLWYTDRYGEERWLADWKMLAARYRNDDTVVGADLHNEPRGPATWGSGDPKTDWRLAAERAGNAILDVNPNWLIVIEGIERYGDKWYWWGGNLVGAAEFPVRLKLPNRLVYSAHDYGPGVSGQAWFRAADFPKNLASVWDAHWAYLARQGLAPVLIGEFGGRSVGEDTEGVWQRELVAFLKARGIHYTYWSLNPNSGDTGGILKDDWRGIQEAKLRLLKTYQAPPMRR